MTDNPVTTDQTTAADRGGTQRTREALNGADAVIGRLSTVLGFDARSRNPGPTSTVFAKALEKVKKEREEKAQVAAEELVAKALEAVEKFNAVQRKFREEEKKFEKECGKLVAGIERLAKGQSVQVDETEAGEKKDGEPSTA